MRATHLKPVPDPAPEHPVIGALTWLHLLNGAIRNRQELERLQLTARRAGRSQYADHLSEAIDALGLAERDVRKTDETNTSFWAGEKG
jgi:hypothetical protein